MTPRPRRLTRGIRDALDRGLGWLKWPVAMLSFCLLPATVLASMALVAQIAQHVTSMLMFLGGAAAYTLLWMALFRHSRFTYFMTLEHELTHVIVALLTFHRVTNLRVTMTRGGVMQFQGKGNWLITIAPYFVPLTSLVLMLVQWLANWGELFTAAIGASFAYHLTSKSHQTHPGQTDLQQEGLLFSWMFLPAAVLLSSGLVVAFAFNGAAQVTDYLADVWETTRMLVGSS